MDTAFGFSVYVRSFRLSLSVEGLKPHTVRCYVRDVERFVAHYGGDNPRKVTRTDIRTYVLDLQGRRAAKTVYEAQLALRRFFRFLLDEGDISDDPTRAVKLTRYRVDPQPTYTVDEVKRLMTACDQSTLPGIRDHAMVMVLFDTGVREGELVSMTVPDWDRRQVTVDGKGGVRIVPLGTAALQTVDRYSRRWGITEGALWRGKKGPLTPSGVIQIVRRLCRKAEVPEKGVHAFRRAAAAQMKRLGMNDSDILEVMGWKDVTMLRRYIAAVATELAQEAHEKFSPGDAIGLR
jgi:integrase/recombinase XerC